MQHALQNGIATLSFDEIDLVDGGATSTPAERARDFSGSMAAFGAVAGLVGAEPVAAGCFALAATSLIVAEFLDL